LYRLGRDNQDHLREERLYMVGDEIRDEPKIIEEKVIGSKDPRLVSDG